MVVQRPGPDVANVGIGVRFSATAPSRRDVNGSMPLFHRGRARSNRVACSMASWCKRKHASVKPSRSPFDSVRSHQPPEAQLDVQHPYKVSAECSNHSRRTMAIMVLAEAHQIVNLEGPDRVRLIAPSKRREEVLIAVS